MLKIDEQYGLYSVVEHLVVGDDHARCRAADPFLGHDVSLQLIKFPEECSAEQKEYFKQRLDALAAIDHAALAPIYDIGMEDSLCYYTTTFFPEGSVLESLKTTLSEQEGLKILKHLAEGLAYADNKGFEHGLISVDDVFQDENDLPVLANFGVAEVQCSLYGSSETSSTPSQIPSLSQKQTLHSLGSLFLSLVLTEEQQSASQVDQIVQLKGDKVKKLIPALLGLSQDVVTSYDELLRQLTEMVPPVVQEAVPVPVSAPPEKPAPEPVDEVAQKIANETQVPDQTVKLHAKISDLAAEKTRLQAQLKEVTGFRSQAERKLVLVEQALSSSQQAEESARQEAMTAWELNDRQQKKPRPFFWFAGGCLLGILFAAAPSYLLSKADRAEKTSEVSQRFIVQRAPNVVAPAPPPAAVEKPAETSAMTAVAVEQPEESVEAVVPVVNKGDEETTIEVVQVSVQEKHESLQVEGDSPTLVAEKIVPSPESTLVFSADHSDGMSAVEKSRLLEALQGWASSWENQDFPAYLNHYSAEYQPEAGLSMEEWKLTRQGRIDKPKWVKIKLDELQLHSASTDIAHVQLKQFYRSDSYGDQTLKSLDLVREDGRWVIWMERPIEE